MEPFRFFKIVLKGTSQVMLQNNAMTGLLFLLGIFYNSWVMGLGTLLGVIISTTAVILFKYNREDIKQGALRS